MLFRARPAIIAASLTAFVAARMVAAAPSVEDALKYAPVQPGVEYDQPAPEEAKDCKITAEKVRDATGWGVRGPDGNILRQFVDSNGDNVVDTWSYYRGGYEVYRDIDSDFDRKADQYRWFHTGGSRWGLDKNQDGKIDVWKQISAEEVAEEAVAAIRTKDKPRFLRLLLAKEEIAQLGLPKELADQLAQRLDAAVGAFDKLAAAGALGADPDFPDFGGQRPGAVPAGTRGMTRDLLAYENVWCMVLAGDQHQQLQLGGLVELDRAWRLIDGPSVGLGEQMARGFFFDDGGAPPPQTALAAMNQPTEEMEKILKAIQAIDDQYDAASADKKAALNAQRADLFEKLAAVSATPADRDLWLRQMVDMINSHVQDGTYPGGLQRLSQLEEKLRKAKGSENLLVHIEFLRMQGAWMTALSDPKADYAKIQEAWLKQLEQFVTKHRAGEDVAEALYQLAMASEYPPSDPETALKWYQRLLADFPNGANAAKARGAIRRLSSVGKPLALKGPALQGGVVDLAQYKGRVVLIHYWSTTVPSCRADHVELLDLYAKYGGRKFEVLGINLDSNQADAVAYLNQHKLPWKQLFEPGGLFDSRLATEMGIIQLPQMILVDAKGQVVNANLLTQEVAAELKTLIPSEVAAK
ncbi:MAG TPA: redoxin family protein [Lacipirellulaceae bacterium]|nr:redoxin family protein [Lacipirellulaceae bacterium]